MGILKNRFFFCIVLFSIFTTIPLPIRLNFIGGMFSDKLSFYPFILGLIVTVWLNKVNFLRTSLYDYLKKYLYIYFGIMLISLLHGLFIYPYYEAILAGPIDQVDKIATVYSFLQNWQIDISEIDLLKVWMFARPIKYLLTNIFWAFIFSYLVYYWYRKDSAKGVEVLAKAVIIGAVIVCLYGLLDCLFLSGNYRAEEILSMLNPIIHDIENNGTWWPPLLWKNQLRSLFAEPSYFGIWVGFAMPWLWYMIYFEKEKRREVFYFLLVFLLSFCLFLTKARTANALLFGEIILLLLVGVVFRKQVVMDIVKICLCIFLSFCCAITIDGFFSSNVNVNPDIVNSNIVNNKNNVNSSMGSKDNIQATQDLAQNYMKENVTSIMSEDKRSNGARFSVAEANIKIGLDHLVLGVGYSLRSAYVPMYLPKKAFSNSEIKLWLWNQKEKGIMKSGFPTLSEYTSRFAETGVIGLSLFIFPALFLFYKLYKKITDEKLEFSNRMTCAFFAISFCGVFASGLGDTLNITCCYWILLGLGYALCFENDEREMMNGSTT